MENTKEYIANLEDAVAELEEEIKRLQAQIKVLIAHNTELQTKLNQIEERPILD